LTKPTASMALRCEHAGFGAVRSAGAANLFSIWKASAKPVSHLNFKINPADWHIPCDLSLGQETHQPYSW